MRPLRALLLSWLLASLLTACTQATAAVPTATLPVIAAAATRPPTALPATETPSADPVILTWQSDRLYEKCQRLEVRKSWAYTLVDCRKGFTPFTGKLPAEAQARLTGWLERFGAVQNYQVAMSIMGNQPGVYTGWFKLAGQGNGQPEAGDKNHIMAYLSDLDDRLIGLPATSIPLPEPGSTP